MPERIKAAVYLPPSNGLPGFEKTHKAFLDTHTTDIEWLSFNESAEFLKALPECTIAVSWHFMAEWKEHAGKLKLLATPAAGKDWIKVKPGNGLDVVFGTFHGELMAETVVGLMLAFCRGIKDSLDHQGREPWARIEIAEKMRPLRGSRVTILGFGHIGKWVARLLKPFGVQISGVNRKDMTKPAFFEEGDQIVPLSELDNLLPTTEHLVMILPGEPTSNNVVDARRISLLPKNAFVYNVGRGNSLDTAALVSALKSGSLSGAGLDVFETEPLREDSPVRGCPNVVLMPHVSAFASNYLDIYMKELAQKLMRHFPEYARCNCAEGE